MSDQTENPRTVRIELTAEQRERVAEALGQARIASDGLSLELSIEELERRITPRIAYN